MMDCVLIFDVLVFSYFFYNIEKIVDDVYCILFVVVGFVVEDFVIEVKENVLIVIVKKVFVKNEKIFLYCGIVICFFE